MSPPKNCTHSCSLPCLTHSLSHPLWFYHMNYIWWRMTIIKLLIMQYSLDSSSPLISPNVFLITLLSTTLAYIPSLMSYTKFTLILNNAQNCRPVYLILVFLDSEWETKRSSVESNVLLISSCEQFWLVSVITKNLNSATFSRDLLDNTTQSIHLLFVVFCYIFAAP